MTTATVFVWEEKDWSRHKGYAYSVEKVNKVAKLLEESAEWVESFDVEGGWLKFKDIRPVSITVLKMRFGVE